MVYKPQGRQVTSLSKGRSIDSRMRDLEINLAKNAKKEQDNLKELCQHKRSTIAKTNSECAHSREFGMWPTEHAKTYGGRRGQGLGSLSGTGLSMNQRLAALRQNAFSNDEIMQGHREFLNTHHMPAATTLDANDHTGDREITTGFHGAQERKVSRQLNMPTNTTEALDMVARVWHLRQRPSSAGSLRPSSAGSMGQRHDRYLPLMTPQNEEQADITQYMPLRTPQNEEQAGITITSLVRVPGRPFSRTCSRPLSANSISGRCAAIKNNLEKNKELLQANRSGINLVVQLRKEARDELERTLMPTTSS